MRAHITRHAIDRARLRWLEPDDAAALRAIQGVIERGDRTQTGRLITCRHGSRCARIVDGAVVTVYIHRPNRLKALLRHVRRDIRERVHWR